MTATIDSNTISIMVNNTVEDIDKAMQILMTLRSEKRINAIEDYWNQFRNGPLRDKSRFSQVHNKTNIGILVVHQPSQRTKKQIVINQFINRSSMSFKTERNYWLSTSLHLVNLILILVEYL